MKKKRMMIVITLAAFILIGGVAACKHGHHRGFDEFDLAAATIHVDEITHFQRDLFGRRTAARTRKIFARDVPRRLVVKAPPIQGRPESFAGAVGRGFSLEAAADRSVVQLGDPITLTLTVRGDGNLASIGLPRLDADGGLLPGQFRIPEGDVSGQLTADGKVFLVDGGRTSLVRVDGLETLARLPEQTIVVTADDLEQARDWFHRTEAQRQQRRGSGILSVPMPEAEK